MAIPSPNPPCLTRMATSVPRLLSAQCCQLRVGIALPKPLPPCVARHCHSLPQLVRRVRDPWTAIRNPEDLSYLRRYPRQLKDHTRPIIQMARRAPSTPIGVDNKEPWTNPCETLRLHLSQMAGRAQHRRPTPTGAGNKDPLISLCEVLQLHCSQTAGPAQHLRSTPTGVGNKDP